MTSEKRPRRSLGVDAFDAEDENFPADGTTEGLVLRSSRNLKVVVIDTDPEAVAVAVVGCDREG